MMAEPSNFRFAIMSRHGGACEHRSGQLTSLGDCHDAIGCDWGQ